MQTYKITDIMTPAPETISPRASIAEAARLMREYDTGFLPVVEDDSIEGVITDRDIAVRAVAEGLDVEDTPVTEAMTAEYHSVFEDQSLDEAIDLMEAQQVRRILVIDREENIVGVLSLGDIAVRTTRARHAEALLEEVSVPKMSKKSKASDRSVRNERS